MERGKPFVGAKVRIDSGCWYEVIGVGRDEFDYKMYNNDGSHFWADKHHFNTIGNSSFLCEGETPYYSPIDLLKAVYNAG